MSEEAKWILFPLPLANGDDDEQERQREWRKDKRMLVAVCWVSFPLYPVAFLFFPLRFVFALSQWSKYTFTCDAGWCWLMVSVHKLHVTCFALSSTTTAIGECTRTLALLIPRQEWSIRWKCTQIPLHFPLPFYPGASLILQQVECSICLSLHIARPRLPSPSWTFINSHHKLTRVTCNCEGKNSKTLKLLSIKLTPVPQSICYVLK